MRSADGVADGTAARTQRSNDLAETRGSDIEHRLCAAVSKCVGKRNRSAGVEWSEPLRVSQFGCAGVGAPDLALWGSVVFQVGVHPAAEIENAATFGKHLADRVVQSRDVVHVAREESPQKHVGHWPAPIPVTAFGGSGHSLKYSRYRSRWTSTAGPLTGEFSGQR